MKKVICINNALEGNSLTLNKEYDVISKQCNFIRVLNDNNSCLWPVYK